MHRGSCRPRYRQWVSRPTPLSPPAPLILTDSAGGAPTTAANAEAGPPFSTTPQTSSFLAVSKTMATDKRPVRACARPVSPVTMLPVLSSVSFFFFFFFFAPLTNRPRIDFR
ncbi:hypothetical protein B0H67DRAFT_206125 [Lasiosphaeris hirsuta]|uniref:Transmembrane protein n=1 Tax=Lasiosphaeris hirsuta TaxID=260670 RepID=A0AA40ARV4_9PEZI|nr:hypothetical protein B0H67DRAFT_206125 [Lasiosphaeris hirsuta]